MAPGCKLDGEGTARYNVLASLFALSAAAGAAFAPEPLLGCVPSGANTFICSEPALKAMVSLLQHAKRKATVAPRLCRTCNRAVAGMPVGTSATLLSAARLKSLIHPRSTQAAGGIWLLQLPISAGSKMVGAPVVRFTGAK